MKPLWQGLAWAGGVLGAAVAGAAGREKGRGAGGGKGENSGGARII